MDLNEFKNVIKNSKDVDNKDNPIKYLSNYDNRIYINKIIKKIENDIGEYATFRNELSLEDKDIIDSKITFSRTMIDGVIQNSTYITKDGIQQINSKHKNHNNLNALIKLVKNSKYIKDIEIDKDTDIDKLINTIKQVNQFNLNVDSLFTLKVRKLGNYNAEGLYMDKIKTVAVDLEKPSALIHELTHFIDHNIPNNKQRNNIINHFKEKINEAQLDGSGYKAEYILNNEEIIARLGEIAFLLETETENVMKK